MPLITLLARRGRGALEVVGALGQRRVHVGPALRLGVMVDRASSSRYRRIALVDGPIVLGAARYREIDARYFLEAIEAAVLAIQPVRSTSETTLLARVLLAALCECALSAADRQHDPASIEAVVDDLIRAV